MKNFFLIVLFFSFQSFYLYASDGGTVGQNTLISEDTVEDSTTKEIHRVCETDYMAENDYFNANNSNNTESGGQNMMIQLISVIITFLALIVAFCSFKSSSRQAKQAYDAFLTESEKQFAAQSEIANAVKKQTDDFINTTKRKEIISNLVTCHTSLFLVRKYLIGHFYDILKNSEENWNFVFDLLQPAVQSASVIQIIISNSTNCQESFRISLDRCAMLADFEVLKQKDMDTVIADISECMDEFKKQIEILKKQ